MHLVGTISTVHINVMYKCCGNITLCKKLLSVDRSMNLYVNNISKI